MNYLLSKIVSANEQEIRQNSKKYLVIKSNIILQFAF